MVGKKRVIGVCCTRVQSVGMLEYISRLYRCAREKGYKILIFNSTVDFYNNDNSDIGSKSVYELINYDIVDVLVVSASDFRNRSVFEDIVKDAKAKGVPVIVLKDQVEGCYCLVNDYRECYTGLMEHVIREHGAEDTFYLAGRREEDPESVIRIGCYKAALERCGLEFSERNVDYGEYWNIPAVAALRRLIEKRGKPPRAVFCANDYMAIAICDVLIEQGYRVPEDVIVTGFDGVPEAFYRIPQLTTCSEDFQTLAENTVGIIAKIFDGTAEPGVTLNSYIATLTESCGCPLHGNTPRQEAQKQYAMVHESLSHEDFTIGWLSRALATMDINSYLSLIPELVLALGYLCLNSDTIDRITGGVVEDRTVNYTDVMEIIPSVYNPFGVGRGSFKRSDIVPELTDWIDNDSLYVISAINCGREVFGYYAVMSSSPELDAHKINRSLNALSIGMNSIAGYYRQRQMLLGLKRAATTDQLSGLPNLKGMTDWFDDFAADPKNHEKCVTVSVYWVPKYKYIYENYGIKEIEYSIGFITAGLREANKKNCIVGRTAADEFIVINYYDKPEDIAPTINAATSYFYDRMNAMNASGVKEYYLEVNAGCTEMYPGWEGSLEAFTKLAVNAMYLNRLNGNVEPMVQKKTMPTEYYKNFELMLENDLIDYHFQPIVEVGTGEIIAYEALMRPHRSIGMNPAEVIQTAEEYGRLDDVEKATMFNVLRRYTRDVASFHGRKIFINSIPGHFMQGDTEIEFWREYRQYFPNLVIEITESSTIEDNELKKLHTINNVGIPIAIDDYGTGHSNIVNLLRYSPQIIKVDRFLITGIENDTNKQLFFRSTVEFAAMNGMKVLAEGVETAEELKCVVELGADLIQGYFTGRPAPEPLDEIPQDVKALLVRG